MKHAGKNKITKERAFMTVLLVYAAILTLFAFQKGGSAADSGLLKEDAGFKLDVEVQSGSPTVAQELRFHPKVASLIEKGYTYETTEYSSAELDALAQKYPVVYGGLENNKGIAAIQFTKGSVGKLLIYSTDTNDVLREFNTQGITLN